MRIDESTYLHTNPSNHPYYYQYNPLFFHHFTRGLTKEDGTAPFSLQGVALCASCPPRLLALSQLIALPNRPSQARRRRDRRAAAASRPKVEVLAAGNSWNGCTTATLYIELLLSVCSVL